MRPPADSKSSLAALARASRAGLITVEAAAAALGVTPAVASVRLARLMHAGWVQRVRRGLYLILPLEAEAGRAATPEDPWVLASELFSPCYVGGWSAAEHWGLSEQLFRPTLVVTAAAVRARSATYLGNEFSIFTVPADRLSAGVVQAWRGRERVPVSGPERTLVDGLRTPSLCGGARHLAEMMREYRAGTHWEPSRLIAVAQSSASGAAWKRLGYLAETLWPLEPEVPSEARTHLTAGNAVLDPDVKRRGRLRTRWRLWVNVDVQDLAAADGADV